MLTTSGLVVKVHARHGVDQLLRNISYDSCVITEVSYDISVILLRLAYE
jgi:hypothetical protein